MVREMVSARGKIGFGLVACVLLASAWLGNAAPAAAQNGVPGTIDSVDVADRTVILKWTPLPGDTLTAKERQRIPQATFVVPDLLGINAAAFVRGDVIVGAGGLTSTPGGDLEIVVGDANDLYKKGQAPIPSYPSQFEVTGAFQFGRNYVGVAFSQPVSAASATQSGSYSFSPGLNIESITLQENEQIAILKTVSDLGPNVEYTVTVNGVAARDGGETLDGVSVPFTTVDGTVVNIAEIQRSPASYPTATIVGSVYIPVDNGNTVPSGYMQDGSRRGIRLTGTNFQDPVNTAGNVVVVTGSVVRSNFAVRMEDYGSEIISAGQPRLAPRPVPLKDSKSIDFRGTYIRTDANLVRKSYSADTQLTRFETSRSDTSFAGYRLWRSESPDPETFVLLRTFSLLDSTWGFGVGAPRVFADPDSIIPRGTEQDRLRDPEEMVPGPFNGFAYYYALTWFDAYLDPTTTPSRVTVFERTTVEEGIYPHIIYPSKKPRAQSPLLGNVKVVPNPYNPQGQFDQQAFPGAPRVQFINLPRDAKVDIYTMAGDHVRSLKHEEDDDSLDWDLKNNDDKDVAPGIYLYYVEAGSETTTGRFVIIR